MDGLGQFEFRFRVDRSHNRYEACEFVAATMETGVNTDKKVEKPKQQPGMKSPDSLTKTTRKGEIELTEEELARVPGGCGTGMSKIQAD